MKQKISEWLKRIPMILAAALVLTMTAAVVIPATLSKYAAVGQGEGKARIAKFHNQFSQVSGHLGGAGYAVRSTASGYYNDNTQTISGTTYQTTPPIFYYKNNSEVSVRVFLVPHYGPGPYSLGANAHGVAGNQVGQYYYNSTTPRSVIPPSTASGGFTGSFNGTTRRQLGYTVYRGATTTNLGATTTMHTPTNFTTAVDITPNATFTTGGAVLQPRQDCYLGVFFQSYDAMPTQYSNQTSTGGNASTPYDMSFAWRTYRINYDLRVTQID